MNEPSHTVRSDVAVLERFLADEILPILKPDGVWAAPNPAPLRASEIRPVFERLATNPCYSSQHFETATWDRKVITLMNGVVGEHGIEGTPWEDAPEQFERGT